MYGPGVFDMKSSLVVTLYAIKHLIETGNDAYKNVQIIYNSDEEVGSVHSRNSSKNMPGQKIRPHRGT